MNGAKPLLRSAGIPYDHSRRLRARACEPRGVGGRGLSGSGGVIAPGFCSLEPGELGADRRERTVLVLVDAEAVGMGP